LWDDLEEIGVEPDILRISDQLYDSLAVDPEGSIEENPEEDEQSWVRCPKWSLYALSRTFVLIAETLTCSSSPVVSRPVPNILTPK
jgi:hypothetical protein